MEITKRIVAFAAAALISCLAISTSASAATRSVLKVSNGKQIDYYSNASIATANSKITHAVILIHGEDRDAGDYAYYGESALKNTSYADQTLLIVPQFGANSRSGYLNWPSDDTYLTDWAYGGVDASSNFSSFQVVDEIVAKLLNKSLFPNLTLITVAGHSAGGQFVHRYSVGTNLDNLPGARMRFVPMNPGSYLYATNKRLVSGSWTTPTSCSSFNRYRYGMDRLNAYMSQMPSSAAARYAARATRLLNGTADTAVDSSTDTTCQANLQGSNRYTRGQIYEKYVEAFWPQNNFQRLDVAGVGHSYPKMLNSTVGRQIVFTPGW